MSDVLNNPLVVAEALKARTEFLKATVNFFSCLRQPTGEVMESITAATALEKEFRDDLESFGQPESINQPSYDAREFCRKSLRNAIYDGLCRALVLIYNRGVISLATRLTDEADLEFLEVRYRAGELPRPIVVPTPKPLSAAQLLEKEVIEDFAGVKSDDPTKRKPPLSADAMRKKMNNSAYREMYNRLAETENLTSTATTAYTADEIGG